MTNDYEKAAADTRWALQYVQAVDLVDPDLEARLSKIVEELEKLAEDAEARA